MTQQSIRNYDVPDDCCPYILTSRFQEEDINNYASSIGILRRIFGPKRDENGEWRRLHNEELHSLYRSPNIVRVIKSRRLIWAGHVARMEEGRSAFKILTGKNTGKRPF